MKRLKTIRSSIAILCILLLVSVTAFAQSDGISATIRIEREDGIAGAGVFPGQTVDVDILLDRTRMLTSGFELMIGYDRTALTLDTVFPGIELFETCDWEIFGYREKDVSTNGSFPTETVQMYGVWDVNSPTTPPCVFPDSPFIRIATMRFTVSHDGLPIDGFLPIQFYWEDCGNNTFGSIDGSTLYMSTVVYDGFGNPITPESSFPTLGGTAEMPDCEIDTARGRTERSVRFYDGGIKIRDVDSSRSLSLRIERDNGSGYGVIQGQTVDVDIILDPTYRVLSGFDLLIGYDKDELEIDTVFPGAELYDSCGWEFFTYRTGANGNAGPNFPVSALFRVIGLYDFNDGITPSECVLPHDRPSRLATVRFKVSNDRTLEGKFFPIQFIWIDCGDNVISDLSGDTLFFSNNVLDPDGIGYELPDSFPSFAGAVPSCYREPSPQFISLSDINFYSGGVQVVDADTIDAPCLIGDINASRVPFETADALMFIDYFVEGISAFGTHTICSIEASDVNLDRTPLTLADLQYTLRTIAGDAIWPPPLRTPNIATFRVDPLTGIVTVESADSIGIVYIEFDEPLDPSFFGPNMKFKYQKSDTLTRIILYSWNRYLRYPEFLKVPPFSRIKNVAAATFDGAQIRTEIAPSFSDTCSPGDINGNGTPYEVADAVMFTNYFSEGVSAFGEHKNCSIQASDVNRDSKTLTIADLDFLIRIVVGDLKPGVVLPTRKKARILFYSSTGIASYHSFYSTSTIMLKFAGRQGAELLSSYARMVSSFDGDTTRIIFLPTGSEIPLGDLVRFSSIPDTIIAEAGTVEGAYVTVEVLRDFLTDVDENTGELLPGEFSLAQNYPNPFNPTTEITFSLPVVSDVTLDIFNINGRLVRQLINRRVQAGVYVVSWDGRDGQGRSVASGMYLYRLMAGENRQTRKMLLLK